MVKRAGLLCAGLGVWGLTTFAIGERPGGTPAVAAMPPIIATHPRPTPPDAAESPRLLDYAQEAPLGRELGAAGRESTPQERPQPTSVVTRESTPVRAPVTERRGRRNRRNVWVGPIPGPEDWTVPEGPIRIALQAGHWKANEAPAELSGLRDNGTAAHGTAEWEVNLAIAERAAELLKGLGYAVDVLPAVVPPSYRAHLFISIHADGSGDARASGFRVAAPRNDRTGRAANVVQLLERSYGEATGIRRLPTVTRRMQNYYAFNFQRYVHALHPMTIAVILETGFLTNAGDRTIIVDDPERAARGIVAAVIAFPHTPPPGPQISLTAAAGAQ
jgi:N-acetylmuramoyl-L-alanine amidase